MAKMRTYIATEGGFIIAIDESTDKVKRQVTHHIAPFEKGGPTRWLVCSG